MRERLGAGGSRRLAILLLAVALPPAAMLVWLGWQLLVQDRLLLSRRDFERRQAAIEAAVHSLQLSLAGAERHITENPIPAGMVRFDISADGVSAQPPDRVAWVPRRLEIRTRDGGHFADAETLEFRGEVDRATAMYEEAARLPDSALRAGALVRLARVRRRQQRWDEALQTYRALASLPGEIIEGAPADLQARRAMCDVLAQAHRGRELTAEAAKLRADLLAGRWPLDRAAWELTVGEIEHWTGQQVPRSPERNAFSSVADLLWSDRTAERRRVVDVGGGPVTLLSRDRPDGSAAVGAVSPRMLGNWIEAAAGNASSGIRLSVLASSGQTLLGAPSSPAANAIKVTPPDSGLPWTIVVHTTPSSDAAELASRRRLLSGGLAAILLLLAGGTYFLWRVVRRELAVARLQADFVSAVSHEFRTPLTAMRHVSELLGEGDEIPADRRLPLYEVLARNTDRLHRLVESLLDFGRMESGRKPYDLRPLDVAALVAQVVEDFQREISSRGYAVDLVIHVPAGSHIRADASAFANALWNLLDNAVKYSPDRHEVHVSVDPHPAGVAVSVRDEGLGIPSHERKEIFGRFVRGERPIKLGIKGTGLGLAMVSHIVRAHGGTIELASDDAAGSTFTIVLPVDAGLASL